MRRVVLAGSLAVASSAWASEPVAYVLEPKASLLYVVVRLDPTSLLAGLGHDHAMAAAGWSGTVAFAPDDPSTCRVHVEVPVTRLVVDALDYRAMAGLTGTPSERDKVKIGRNMLGEDVLDSRRWATVSFDATSCTGADGTYEVTGDFTLRGQSRPIAFPMRVDADGKDLHAMGAFTFRGSDWGMVPDTGLGGGLRNEDVLAIHIDVKGRVAP